MSISGPANNEARFYEVTGERVRCLLCPHGCTIPPRKRGRCGVRENRDGRLYSLIYGMASSIHPDPIEKKPLFHFLPGSTAISFGSVGCNLDCRNCQNYSISRASPSEFTLTRLSPKDVVAHARACDAESVSWTYNEPTIWYEFTTDASEVAHEAGLKTSYVTNGYISEEPLAELRGIIDAMNIDVKSFREKTYSEVCGGHLAPVLRTCEAAVSYGIHVELTYLIIPDLNDSEAELSEFVGWVKDALRTDVPVHFSAFHPDYRMTEVPRTPMTTMNKAYDIARRTGLEFVYLGNVHAGDRDDTYCPSCGALVIEREGFSLTKRALHGDKCAKCGHILRMVV
ncbi:TPA: AmmeMemoRadiSam system radical SAM enzyme [Thermoplasmata archaeon]|nr:AmmeMemoRadiSam system radical SAM enzyme [Thermoplasmata archaeon]